MLWNGVLTGMSMLLTQRKFYYVEKLKNALGDTPILFTFRTAKEGGEKEISNETYKALNMAVAKSGYVDLIDVEAFTGDDIVKTSLTLLTRQV